MSGGHFDYNQHRIQDIIDETKRLIEINGKEPDLSEGIDDWANPSFSKKTIKEFKKGVKFLEKAKIYTQRIDWLVSGDDGEDSFHKRLKEELDEL